MEGMMGFAATPPIAVAASLSAALHVFSDAAMSGERWAARAETRTRALRDGMLSAENRIERKIGKIKRQDRRNGGKSCSKRCLRHADRAEIVGMTVVPVGLPVVMMREGGEQHAGSGFPAAEAFQMNVTKRQRKVYRERQQRQRRTLPYFGTKPLHSENNLMVS